MWLSSLIKSTQLGYKTAIIENSQPWEEPVSKIGCIPPKTLLESYKYYFQALEALINTVSSHFFTVNSIPVFSANQ